MKYSDFLNALLSVMTTAGTWGVPTTDGDSSWLKNSWWNVPQERWVYSRSLDPNEECSAIFGKNPNKFAGCVSYGFDEDGPISYLHVPKKARPSLLEHEERHAAGEIHPWEGYEKELGINK